MERLDALLRAVLSSLAFGFFDLVRGEPLGALRGCGCWLIWQSPRGSLFFYATKPCSLRGEQGLGWSGAESNRRHRDFQSRALPTELPDHL